MGHFVCILAVRKDVIQRGWNLHRKHFRVWHDHPEQKPIENWLVVSTHLKNISQIGSSPQVRDENNKYLKPPPRYTIDWFQKLLFPKTRRFSPEEYGGKHEPPTRRDLHCDKSAPGRIRNLQRFGRSPSGRSPSDRLGIYTTKGQEAFPREEIETTWSFWKTLEYGKVNWDSRLGMLSRVSFSKMCWSCFHHAQMRHV